MKENEHKHLRYIVVLYAICTPVLLALTLWLFLGWRGALPEQNTDQIEKPEPEYIYVYTEVEPNTDDTTAQESTWVVREHEEKIGVFSEDGVLLRVVDVYTKTLPRADRVLLREGIAVTSRQDLYALMEDFGA